MQNLTSETVNNPECSPFGICAFGVVPVDRPDAALDPIMVVSADCADPGDFPPGYDENFSGPTFRIGDLRSGASLATVEYVKSMRSTRLTARVAVP